MEARQKLAPGISPGVLRYLLSTSPVGAEEVRALQVIPLKLAEPPLVRQNELQRFDAAYLTSLT